MYTRECEKKLSILVNMKTQRVEIFNFLNFKSIVHEISVADPGSEIRDPVCGKFRIWDP